MTQKQLGESVGITAAAVGNYERGDRYIPAELIHDLAQALDVPDQFISAPIPTNIKDKDLINNDASGLLQKMVSTDKWKNKRIGQQIQTIQILDLILREEYTDLFLEREYDSEDLKEVKLRIFDFFNDFNFDPLLIDQFHNFNDNFDVIYNTGLFFFNYIVEQKKLYKGSNSLKFKNFVKKARNFLAENGYSTDLMMNIKDED